MKAIQNTKIFAIAAVLSIQTISSISLAADNGFGPKHPHKRLELTDEQKSCLEKILGKPGEGSRPSHEQMRSASEKCNIPRPPARPDRTLEEYPSEDSSTGVE